MKISNFYDNVEAERRRKKLTIEQLATKLGIDERTYRQRMYVLRDLRATEVVKYAEVLNVSVDYLLGLTDKINIA